MKTVTYAIMVAIAAPKAPINGMRIRFNMIFKIAPIIAVHRDVTVFFFKEYTEDRNVTSDTNAVATSKTGIYIQASWY